MKDLLEIATKIDGISALMVILAAEVENGGASKDILRDSLHSLGSYLEMISDEIGESECLYDCTLRKEGEHN